MPYQLITPAGSSSLAGKKETQLDILRRVGVFIRDRVIARTDGKLPGVAVIATRLLVLQEMLQPSEHGSLHELARELNCTASYLSKVGVAFADELGISASWQRIQARAAYAERARAVHSGTWTASPKWERRKLREAKAATKSRPNSRARATTSAKSKNRK